MYNTLVNVDTLQSNLSDWLVLDCRFQLTADGSQADAGVEAYKVGHIPGAHYLHLEKDLSSAITLESGRHPLPDVHQLAETLSALGLTEKTQVVVYDDAAGFMAARAWWLLRWMGHDAVALLDGGFAAWQQAGADISTKKSKKRSGDFVSLVQAGQTVEAELLQQLLSANEIDLVDARAQPRFAGLSEPIDPVAGHVPGALNRPMNDNLQEDNTFKPAGVLHAEWRAVIGDRTAADVVHMCGSGVTACHNILAMEVAGLSGSRLYPGSWSEWIRDPARGVATES